MGSSRPARYSLHSTACLRIPAYLPDRRLGFPICRVFTTTPQHRKDVARIPQPKSTIPPQTAPLKGTNPEVVKAKAAKPKQDILLAEQTVSNAQQRKADWAILKEMTAYLWPKVRVYPSLDERLPMSNSSQERSEHKSTGGSCTGLAYRCKGDYTRL